MIIFKNKGVIDLAAITTFGISAKETENPIGFFGTGLKYSIAVIMRENQSLTLMADTVEYTFRKVVDKFRGKDFQFIEMIGDDDSRTRLPFTTELGKNWKLWQAYRELYCNTKDENGTIETVSDVKHFGGETTFVVKGNEFEKIHSERSLYFLDINASLLIQSNGYVEIYDKPSKNIFYKGIRVHDLDRPALFTYNFVGKIDLTEDRTMMYVAYECGQIIHCAAKIEDERVLMKMLMAGENTLEGGFDWSAPSVHSPAFEKIVHREFEFNNEEINKTAFKIHRAKNKLDAKSYVIHEPTSVENMMLERCMEIIQKVFPHFDGYEYMVVQNLGASTMALADISLSKFYISRECFKMGTKFLLSTMIEELTHLHYKYRDCTREMQTHLFDTISTLIEEHVLEEPV